MGAIGARYIEYTELDIRRVTLINEMLPISNDPPDYYMDTQNLRSLSSFLRPLYIHVIPGSRERGGSLR